MSVKLSFLDFVEKCKVVHGDKYNYEKVNYVNNKKRIIIICNKHGEFVQTPQHHLRGSGCSYCSGKI